MTFDDWKFVRQKWPKAAQIYYKGDGDDTGMDDYQWDGFAQELLKRKDLFKDCPILNDENYKGGSLYWVTEELYTKAKALYPE